MLEVDGNNTTRNRYNRIAFIRILLGRRPGIGAKRTAAGMQAGGKAPLA